MSMTTSGSVRFAHIMIAYRRCTKPVVRTLAISEVMCLRYITAAWCHLRKMYPETSMPPLNPSHQPRHDTLTARCAVRGLHGPDYGSWGRFLSVSRRAFGACGCFEGPEDKPQPHYEETTLIHDSLCCSDFSELYSPHSRKPRILYVRKWYGTGSFSFGQLCT